MTSDPTRLSDASSSSLARELLNLGKQDAAGALVRQGAHQAAQQALSSALAGAGGTTTFFSSALAKWLGIGLGVGVVGAGLAGVLTSSHGEAPAPTARPSAAVGVVRNAAPEAPAAVSLDELPLAPPVSSNVGSGGRMSQQPAADGLEREIEILDRARKSVAEGRPAVALGELDAHAGDLKVLLPEAQSLRIEALYAAGRRSEADELASRFLASHATSPLAARVLALKNGRAPGAQSP